MKKEIVPYERAAAERRIAFVLWINSTKFIIKGMLTQIYSLWYAYKFARQAVIAFGVLGCSFALFSASTQQTVSLAQMPTLVLQYDTTYTTSPDGVVDVELHDVAQSDGVQTFGPIASERGKNLDNYDMVVRQYIKRFAPVAHSEMLKYGVPASIALAQGILESRSGTSALARANNNHFGMKCFSKHCRKGHCSNFTDDSHKDFFRIYQSPWESYRAHSLMLSSGRYASLKKYGRDYKKWAYGLKRLGYATNGTYAEKIISLIRDYKLDVYDK